MSTSRAPFRDVVNVVRDMQMRGHPDEDIDREIYNRGWTYDEFIATYEQTHSPISNILGDTATRLIGPAVQGATFGFADELKGAMRGGARALMGQGSFGDLYDEETNRARAQLRTVREEMPWASTGAEVAGAVLGSTLLPSVAVQGAGAGSNIARSAVQGAMAGALYGAGSGETLADRAPQAGFGALVGGAVGGGVSAAIEAGKALYRSLAQGLTTRGAQRGAERLVSRAMQRDNLTPNDVRIRMEGAQQLGKPVTMSDVGGPNLQGLSETVATNPGGGQAALSSFLDARSKSQLARMASDLSSAFGTSKRAYQTVEKVSAEMADAARPLYERAMAFDLRQAPDALRTFVEATRTPMGNAALARARVMFKTEFRGQDPANHAMAMVDLWKKALDDKVSSALRAGKNNEARVLQGLRSEVLAAIDAVNPDYAAARAAWSGPAQFLDAIKLGQSVLSAPMDEWVAKVRALPASEAEGVRIGAFTALIDSVAKKSAKMPDLFRAMSSPDIQAKLSALVPDEQAFSDLLKKIDLERAMAETANKALGNSRTAVREALRMDANDGALDVTIEALEMLRQSPSSGGILQQLAAKLLGLFRENDTRFARRLDALGTIVRSTDPATVASLGQTPPTGAFASSPATRSATAATVATLSALGGPEQDSRQITP